MNWVIRFLFRRSWPEFYYAFRLCYTVRHAHCTLHTIQFKHCTYYMYILHCSLFHMNIVPNIECSNARIATEKENYFVRINRRNNDNEIFRHIQRYKTQNEMMHSNALWLFERCASFSICYRISGSFRLQCSMFSCSILAIKRQSQKGRRTRCQKQSKENRNCYIRAIQSSRKAFQIQTSSIRCNPYLWFNRCSILLER